MDEEDNKINIGDLVEIAYGGVEQLFDEFNLPYDTSSLAAFTVVYGVHTPEGNIAVGHATPSDFRFDTPLVLAEVAKVLHEDNASEIGNNN